MFGLFTSQFAGTANSFCCFAHALLGRFLIVLAHLHLTENAFTLHFLLQGTECLIDVVIAYRNFNHARYLLPRFARVQNGQQL